MAATWTLRADFGIAVMSVGGGGGARADRAGLAGQGLATTPAGARRKRCPLGTHELPPDAISAGARATAGRDGGSPATPGGVLKWANSEQGDSLYWLMEGTDPNHWPIMAATDAAGDGWYRFDGSNAEFVFQLLTDPEQRFPQPPISTFPGSRGAPESRSE